MKFIRIRHTILNLSRSLFTLLLLCSTLVIQAQHTAKGLEKLLKKLNKTTNNTEKAALFYQVGLWYEKDKGYEKEVQYLEQAYRLERKQRNNTGQINNLQHLVYAYKQVGLYADAISHSKSLLKLYKKQENDDGLAVTLRDLSLLHKLTHNYKKTIAHNKDLVKIYQKTNNHEELVKTYADLGFLYKKTNKAERSLEYYNKALQLNQNIAGKTNRQADLLINVGFIYHRMLNNKAKAKVYYSQALPLKQQTNDAVSQAMLHNEIGQIDYENGDKKMAESHTQKAVALTKNKSGEQHYSILAKSYQLLAGLHAQDQNHKASTEYYARHLAVKNILDSLAQVKHEVYQEKLRKVQSNHKKAKSRLFAKERKRHRLQDLILKQENEIKELRIKEKEIALIKRNQELQAEQIKNAELERNKVQQLLALAEQKRLTEQQKAVAERQKHLAEQQKMLAEKQKLEKEKKEHELKVAQKEKELQKHKLEAAQKAQALQQKQLEHEKERGKLRDYLFVLLAIVVVLVLMGLFFTARSRKKLKVKNGLLHEANNEISEQKEEIMMQNEELSNRNEEIEAQRDAIEVEKTKSDKLLLNILPYETAQELKDKGASTPQHYKQVSVIFTDFKGFTKLAEKLTPEEVIAELNYCFTAFDNICEKYNIEKIKTIGDAYMAAGGIPVANDTNPIDAIKAGLEMQEFMAKWKAEKEAQGLPVWELRLGIHTGELVAGVVGKNKFAYDIWGDTVNLAARMESSGEPGMVNVSGDTYQLVKNHFETEYRGKIKAKNKGEVDMYFVKGKTKGHGLHVQAAGKRSITKVKSTT